MVTVVEQGHDAPPGRLGTWIGQSRRAAGLTQRQLADRSGVSVGAVRDLEQGRTTRPRPELVESLTRTLGLDPQQLVRPADQAGGTTEEPAAQVSDFPAQTRGLRVGILGPLVAWQDGVQVELGASRQRAVLGLLAAHAGGSLHREAIIDVIWPEDPPKSAIAMVQSYVSLLRQILGDVVGRRDPGQPGGLLVCDGSSYRLRLAGRQLDLLEFTELAARGGSAAAVGDHTAACEWFEQAVGLWRGEPLADVELLRGHPAITGLARRRAAVVLAYAEVASAAGWHERVLAHLRDLADRDRLDERVHARLMIALAGSGQQAAALRVFELLQQRLDGELGVGPGAEVADARAGIMRSGAGASGASGGPPGGPVGGASGVVGGARQRSARTAPQQVGGQPGGLAARLPRQLPPATRHFVGRAEELKELSELLDQVEDTGGAAVISAIGGTAGVGKTALAVYWAHQVTDSFPDGQLYVNLRGFDPSATPVKPAEAIRGFLDALGIPPERIPPALDARTGLLRSLLAGKRMLILLDNARDAGQLRPLLPAAPGCLALITSRNQLTSLAATHGAQMLPLDVLTGIEATELLARRLGPQRVAGERQAVTQLTRLCASLPLALAIIAARAAVRRNLPLTALVAELLDAHSVLDALDGGDTDTSIRAVFSWSYRQLGDQAAQMFRLLGAHPGPDISVPAAASLASLPIREAHRALAELTGAHLLAEHSSGRFAFHDLLRAYAAELARGSKDGADLRAARLRALDHYLHTGFAAALLLEPHRGRIALSSPQPGVQTEQLADYQQALAWFQAEHQVMLAAVFMAASSGCDTHAWQLSWTLADFLDWRGYWHDGLATQQTALDACRRLGDVEGQAHARRSLARVCNQLGSYDDTRSHLREALSLYGETGDVLGRARCHIDMAAVLERQACYDEAIDHAQQALQLFRTAGHTPGQANALNAVGWCHAMAGHHALALSYCQQAIDLQRELGDKTSEAATWDSIGYAHHHLGQYAEAVACYRRALGFYQEIGHRRNQAQALTHLADTQQASGDVKAARESWRQALTILDDLHHPDADNIRARLARPR